jgi:5-methylcytosine-specific restriction enzyme A
MPVKPKRPCSTPGCAALVAEGSRCPAHQAAHYRQQDAGRPSSSDRGYDTRWRTLRLHVLAREPLCRSCRARGLIKRASEVDHIVPIRAGGARYDKSNLQPLCRSCHSAKTMRESVKLGAPNA